LVRQVLDLALDLAPNLHPLNSFEGKSRNKSKSKKRLTLLNLTAVGTGRPHPVGSLKLLFRVFRVFRG
jgi:hypothetical protein